MTVTNIRLRVLPRVVPIDGEDGAAATIAVGTVSSLAAGSPATVVNIGTPAAAVLNFGIPAGAKGDPGADGTDGIMASVVAGTSISVNSADPANPIVSFAPADNSIAPAKLTNGSALSVLGVTGNASAARADIAAASDHQVLRRSGTAVAFGAVNLAQTAAVTGVLPEANLPDASTTAQGVSEFATAAEYRTGTDTVRSLVVDQVWAAAALAVLTDGANIAVDLAAGFNFGGSSNAPLALGGNRTLSAPSNLKTGQTGILWFSASTSTRTLTLNAAWLLMDGIEAGPYSITTAQVLGLVYVVRDTSVYVTGILRK